MNQFENGNGQYKKGKFTETGFCFGKMNETKLKPKAFSASAYL